MGNHARSNCKLQLGILSALVSALLVVICFVVFKGNKYQPIVMGMAAVFAAPMIIMIPAVLMNNKCRCPKCGLPTDP